MILLDLMMPVMDGRAFRTEQRRDPELAGIPVVVVSAYLDVGQEVEEMGVERFLRKPLDAKVLLNAVEENC
jgi:CheY-like chemotaxis protein